MSKSLKQPETDSAPLARLAAAIGLATKSAKFAVDGTLAVADPGLVVEGIGRVPLPFKRGAAKLLTALGRAAPYGKGTETLTDEKVRKTFELDPSQFTLGDSWNAAIADATRTAARSLGLPGDRLEAKLYKLLVYEKGGFFLPHRDSEKLDRMVASLIAVLPNPFEGGSLVVRHGPAERDFPFREAAAAKGACFAAFYADCEHEVRRVTSGVRIALAYNLVLAPDPAARPDTTAPPSEELVAAIGSWVARHPAEPLVFALDHHYTPLGLSRDLLKGADRRLADAVAAAAKHAGCHVYLAQVSRHLTNSAFGQDDEYSNDDSDEYVAADSTVYEIGEVLDDALYGEEWADIDGHQQPWRSIGFDPSAVICSTPLDDWKPTEEEYEGYTGNAGNTLDRWYHRSAVVIWHREHHYEVVAAGNAAECIPQFTAMLERLPQAPRADRDEAREECLRFARALVANWPRRSSHSKNAPSPCDSFPRQLLTLNDRDIVAAFLKVLAERDEATPLNSFVVAAGRQFGWDAFERELKALIAPAANQYGHRRDLAVRDLEWLAEFCGEKTHDPDWRILAGGLGKLAVERFLEHKDQSRWGRERDRATDGETSLPHLLRALAAAGRDDDFARVVGFVRGLPRAFTLDYGQVPALKSLIPWSRERFGSVYPPLQSWLDAVRSELEQAVARKPAPPSDWARLADVNCKCGFCVQLNTFLADPKVEVARIPAAEDKRNHLIQQIQQQELDARHQLERTGRPYTLVLTKTTGSHDRAVKRFAQDRQLLNDLLALA